MLIRVRTFYVTECGMTSDISFFFFFFFYKVGILEGERGFIGVLLKALNRV